MSEETTTITTTAPKLTIHEEIQNVKFAIRDLRSDPKCKWSEVAGRYLPAGSEEFWLIAKKGLKGAHKVLGNLTNRNNKLFGVRASGR